MDLQGKLSCSLTWSWLSRETTHHKSLACYKSLSLASSTEAYTTQEWNSFYERKTCGCVFVISPVAPKKYGKQRRERKLNQQELQKFSAFCLFSIECYLMINYFSPRKFVWLREAEQTMLVKSFFFHCASLQTFDAVFRFIWNQICMYV